MKLLIVDNELCNTVERSNIIYVYTSDISHKTISSLMGGIYIIVHCDKNSTRAVLYNKGISLWYMWYSHTVNSSRNQ